MCILRSASNWHLETPIPYIKKKNPTILVQFFWIFKKKKEEEKREKEKKKKKKKKNTVNNGRNQSDYRVDEVVSVYSEFFTDALLVCLVTRWTNWEENSIKPARNAEWLQWVPSHCGIPVNELADQLAKRGAAEH